MFVARARFDHVERRLRDTEHKLAEKEEANHRLISQLQHHRDEHPDTPVPVQPAVGDARLRHLLALSERARAVLDMQRLGLIAVNAQKDKELYQLREQLAALQAATTPVEEDAS